MPARRSHSGTQDVRCRSRGQRGGFATTGPAHWYPDPADPDTLRWWNGSSWTEHTAPHP
ncbi:DUF2510 domain-containing protein [Nocardia abscessus]|uniref:DUF2510 domain-containing protein n=1 Tax=Nocardia abscessus TaxID=120957 RepID=A0ABS0C9W3_9NOCA|nr:DUF2510 domain-containing protein [Nocardia abscessus]MBF6227139.1 DUF2510 domain-containing protein [Nocardia abscessus]